jgi:peroxiredoxin
VIAPGDTAPDFTLPDQDGETVTLSSLRGQKVVVYFYPKADTHTTMCSRRPKRLGERRELPTATAASSSPAG